MKIVSACLLGIACRYDGAVRPCQKVLDLAKNEVLIPICPEQLGGLPTPRVPSEIQNSTGENVLIGKAKVLNKEGKDVSAHFIGGANETLKIVRLYGATEFIGKAKSPSCGSGKIHDGSFSDTLKEGDGITTALLKQNHIKVITEQDL